MTAEFPEYPNYASGWGVAEAPPPEPAPRPDHRGEFVAAGAVVVVLAVLGALLGLVWSAWSGPQQRAYVIAPGKLFPFDEVETMASADGRYLFLTALLGLAAGIVTWFVRRSTRGAIVLTALGAGALAGAFLTWWVGYLSGGGTYDGKTGTIIAHLPLSLQMHGLAFVEPALAVLGYGLFTAFAAHDDLGRPEPIRPAEVNRTAAGAPGDANIPL